MLYQYDVPEEMYALAQDNASGIGVDIETTGLDAKKDTITTIQIWYPKQQRFVGISNPRKLTNFLQIMRDPSIAKVFHHAMFDLKFLCWYYDFRPENVQCTKIAAKLADPKRKIGFNPDTGKGSHSYKAIVKHYMGVDIDKTQQMSFTELVSPDQLTPEQIAYMENDVKYLVPIRDSLEYEIAKAGKMPDLFKYWQHLPLEVHDSLEGIDMYAY